MQSKIEIIVNKEKMVTMAMAHLITSLDRMAQLYSAYQQMKLLITVEAVKKTQQVGKSTRIMQEKNSNSTLRIAKQIVLIIAQLGLSYVQ